MGPLKPPARKDNCTHQRCICGDCRTCYYCHHEAIYNWDEDKWYWKCPNSKLKRAEMDNKYNAS